MLLDAIYQITNDKIQAAGGMAAWDALSVEERSRRNSTLHAELCQKYGEEEFEKLSQEERDDADFFLGGGCFMHKDLNAHRGEFYFISTLTYRACLFILNPRGVDSMMASWLKNGFEQPVLLTNKDNDAAANSGSAVAKARAEKVSSRGGVKLCELMGMLLNNKDDKKAQQDSHGVYFNEYEGGSPIGFTHRAQRIRGRKPE